MSVYVGDYFNRMEIIRTFWEVAAEDDPSVADLPEVHRYALCKPEASRQLSAVANLEAIEVAGLEAPVLFEDFDDYWSPYLGGQAPAAGYAMSLTEDQRIELRERIRQSLPIEPGGSIGLVARAWAVRGTP